MPRQARLDAPGCIYHLIARGIERRKIFADVLDYQAFVERLQNILIDTDTPIFAFCLMPNHFHLLIKRTKRPISAVMQRLLTGYAIYFNKRHNRAGHLFQNRYKAIICQEDSYLLELVRYINLNPIRAGLVRTIQDLEAYPFSSHPYIIGQRSAKFFDADEIRALFSKDQKAAVKIYRDFLQDGLSIKPDLEGGGLKRSLAITNYPRGAQAYDSRILGESSFVENLLSIEEKQDHKDSASEVDEIIASVCEKHGITQTQMIGNAKRAQITKARFELVQKLSRETGLSGSQIPKTLKISKAAVSRIISRIPCA